ncbi:O-acyltransferase like protein-like [Euwallacea fornicatus]|uniref:O-acyltransferase like protein-like n=1 Tax=Euwallacea fornicatus TaxID=995702 RepID=UPI00338E2002
MLKWWSLVFFITLLGKSSFSHQKTGIRGNSIDDKFPNLYEMEDYYSCPPGYSFCTINMKLIPQDGKSDIWKELESWSVSDFHYNRTVVHRTLCIPPCFRNGSQLKHFAESKVNKELEAYNLTTQMFSYDCLKHQGDLNDFMPHLSMFTLHLGLIVVATLYHLYGGSGDKPNIVQKIVLCFSLMHFIRNFSKAFKTENLDTFKKIKCMDGGRLLSAIFVIIGHAFLMITSKQIKNPNEVEQFFEWPIIQVLSKFTLVIIQIYFVISSWLLTRQILNLHFLEGEFSIRHCILTFVHRIAKIWPPMIYIIFVIIPPSFYFLNGPAGIEITNRLKEACTSSRKFWSFLHVTNLFRNFDVCHVGFWSLSLDTQYYLINIIFLYITLKYKIDIKKSLAILFVMTYFIWAFQMYSNNIRLSMWMSMKLLGYFSALNKPEFSYIYFGFFVNYASSLVGILFGYIDFQTRNIKRPVASKKIYRLITISLVFSFLLHSRNYSVLATSLLCPILKISFSLGVGLTFYGISRNIIRGPLKWVLEHKYVQVLASFSYAVYLFHFLWVISRGAHNSSVLEFTLLGMLWIFVQDCVMCFAIGIFATLTISIPSLLLEYMFLPQIRSKKQEKEE